MAIYSGYHQHMIHKNLISSLGHNQIHQLVAPLQFVPDFLVQDAYIFYARCSPLFGRYLHISWLYDSAALIINSNSVQIIQISVFCSSGNYSKFMMLQCDPPNSKLFPLLAALDTLRRLCDKSGTYKTSDILHVQIFPFGTVTKLTISFPSSSVSSSAACAFCFLNGLLLE